MNTFKTIQSTSLLVTRLIVAAIFIFSTIAKWEYLQSGALDGSGAMLYLTWFLMIVEPLGAIALLAGFLTRWAAAGLGVIMFGSVFFLRFAMGFAFFTMQAPGLDYNVLIFAGCLTLLAFGAGPWSIDARMSEQSYHRK